jgi:hypothetical protein
MKRKLTKKTLRIFKDQTSFLRQMGKLYGGENAFLRFLIDEKMGKFSFVKVEEKIKS